MNREERLKFRRQNQALFASKENGQHQPPGLPPPVVPQKAPKPKAARKSAAERDAALEQRGRLPDGATICGSYDAKTRKWQLALIPVVGVPFTCTSSGLFVGLQRCDDLFRQWLKENPQ